jgi:hypothetical protein
MNEIVCPFINLCNFNRVREEIRTYRIRVRGDEKDELNFQYRVETEQSSKLLLLAFDSTVVLGFGPHRHPWPNVCSSRYHLFVCKWGHLFDERRGCSEWPPYLLHRIQCEYAHTHAASK